MEFEEGRKWLEGILRVSKPFRDCLFDLEMERIDERSENMKEWSLEKGLCLRGTPSKFFRKLFTFPFGG